MKAILIKRPGGVEQLYMGEAEMPDPADKEILVKVMATSVNRMDIIQREGRYPVPKGASPILGVDMAGIVDKRGPGSSRWKPGDKVMGLLSRHGALGAGTPRFSGSDGLFPFQSGDRDRTVLC